MKNQGYEKNALQCYLSEVSEYITKVKQVSLEKKNFTFRIS
jgi:hypothetical protein